MHLIAPRANLTSSDSYFDCCGNERTHLVGLVANRLRRSLLVAAPTCCLCEWRLGGKSEFSRLKGGYRTTKSVFEEKSVFLNRTEDFPPPLKYANFIKTKEIYPFLMSSTLTQTRANTLNMPICRCNQFRYVLAKILDELLLFTLIVQRRSHQMPCM